MGRWSAFLRLGPFAINTLLVFISGIVSVPFVIYFAGPSSWAGIAVCQAIAGLGGVIVSYGFMATGPTRIAMARPDERPTIYWNSLQLRLIMFGLVAPVAAICSAAISGLDAVTSVLATSAYLVQALGAFWYFVGDGRPWRVILFDTAPRIGGIALGILALAAGGSIALYALAILLGTSSSVGVSTWRVLRGEALARLTLTGLRSEARRQRSGMVASSTGAIYANSPMLIVTLLAGSSLESFALAFKIYQYGAAAVQPAVQAAQAWVPSGQEVPRRARRMALMATSLGLAVPAVALIIYGPLSSILSRGAIALDRGTAVALAICLGAFAMNQIVGLACLPAVDRTRTLAGASSLAMFLGIPSMAIAALAFGAFGVALVCAIVEYVVTALLYAGLFRRAPFLD